MDFEETLNFVTLSKRLKSFIFITMANRFKTHVVDWFYKEDAVEYFLGWFSVIGLWPNLPINPQNKWGFVIHGLNLCELSLLSIVSFFLSPITIYHSWGVNMMITSEIAGGIFAFGLAVVQICCFFYRADRFERMFEDLKKMKALGRLHRERPEETIEAGKRLTMVSMVYFVGAGGTTTFCGLALVIYCWKTRNFVVRLWMPFDYKQSPYFDLTISALIIMATYSFYIIVFVNSLLLSIFALTALQLKVLNHNISNLFSNSIAVESRMGSLKAKSPLTFSSTSRIPKLKPLKTVVAQVEKPVTARTVVNFSESARRKSSTITLVGGFRKVIVTPERLNEKAENRFRHCVKHHQAITRFISEVEKAFGFILFFQFVCVVCPVIIAIILVVYADTTDEKTFFVMGLMLTAMTQQGLVCYLAEKVTSESENVRDAVIGCDWYEASEGFQRSMRIVMSRSNQPLTLKPMRIPVTMETFYEVLKLTFKFYTSLVAMLDTSLQDQQ